MGDEEFTTNVLLKSIVIHNKTICTVMDPASVDGFDFIASLQTGIKAFLLLFRLWKNIASMCNWFERFKDSFFVL